MSIFDMGKNTSDILKSVSQPQWIVEPLNNDIRQAARIKALEDVRAKVQEIAWHLGEDKKTNRILGTIDTMIKEAKDE